MEDSIVKRQEVQKQDEKNRCGEAPAKYAMMPLPEEKDKGRQ
jgi:hypothetical protein